MKRRSMLMRLFSLCGFAAPGLNAVAESVMPSSGGMNPVVINGLPRGWIGLAVVGDDDKLWYPPRRQVDRLRTDGLHTIEWDEIEEGDWVLITDFNDHGRAHNQESFISRGTPDGSVDSVGWPCKVDPIELDVFWGMAKRMNDMRVAAQKMNYKWKSVSVPDTTSRHG